MSELYVDGKEIIGPVETGTIAEKTDTYLKCSGSWVKKGNILQVNIIWTAQAALTQGTTYVSTIGLPERLRPIEPSYTSFSIGNKAYAAYINSSGNYCMSTQTSGFTAGYGTTISMMYICKGA